MVWPANTRYLFMNVVVLFLFAQAFVDNSHGQKIKISLFDEDKASDDESLGK